MPSSSTYAVFLATAVVLLAIPGPAVLYVVTRSIEMGRAGGIASVAGIHTGTVVHISLAAPTAAFAAVRYVGAASLLFLGLRRLLDRRPEEAPEEPLPRTRRRAYA